MNKKILRKFGFKTDQSGIINRYLREEGGWDEHLQNSKNYILKSSESKNKELAIILGSGWLLDIPINELSNIFDKVVLVDVCHPRQIEHKLRNTKNIEFLSTDITGLTTPIYELFKKKRKDKIKLTDIKPQYDDSFNEYIQKADLVISLNILNQLDILICDYIKKLDLYNNDEINSLRNYIQSSHIKLLPIGKSAIITDYKQIQVDDNNKELSSTELIFTNLPPKKHPKEWIWKFDQNKTYNKDFKTFFKVMASEV